MDRYPADVHDVRTGIARLPVNASTLDKIGRASKTKLTLPDGAPIADWRHR